MSGRLDDRSRLLTDQTRILRLPRHLLRRFPHAALDVGLVIVPSGSEPSHECYVLLTFLSRVVFLRVEEPQAKRVSGCASTRGVRCRL